VAQGPFLLYRAALLALARGQVNLETVPVKAMLVGQSYTPNLDGHTALTDVTGEVSTAGGYARVPLTGPTVTAISRGFAFGADTIDFGGNITVTGAKRLVLYLDSPSLADKPPLAVMDLETDAPAGVSVAAGSFRVQLAGPILTVAGV
jgi:hypothetical protein